MESVNETTGHLYSQKTHKMIGILIVSELLIVLFLSTFSEPVVELLGKPILPINLENSSISREGRIILLYHSLAIPFVGAIALHFIDQFSIRHQFTEHAKVAIFTGSLLSGLGGITYGYILENMFMHTVFILGMAIIFYGGVLLCIATFPKREEETSRKESELQITPFGRDFLQLNAFFVITYFLISAAIGGLASSFFANRDAFLAEDIVRNEHHDLVERMIISHLHIMVALLVTGIFLMMVKYSEISGKKLDFINIATIPGSLLVSIGAWLVIADFAPAHQIINVGAMILIVAGFVLAIFGIRKIIWDNAPNNEDITIMKKIKLLMSNPSLFTFYFMLIWGNFVTTVPGVYVAINLDTFRSPSYLEVERSFNVAHWHILAALIGIATVLLFANEYPIPTLFKKLTGYFYLSGGIIGFGGGAIYMIRDPVNEAMVAYISMNIGIFLLFIGTIIFSIGYIISLLGLETSFYEKDDLVAPTKIKS